MSIINDALKKTQANLRKPDPKEDNKAEPKQKKSTTPINIYEKLYKKNQEQQDTPPSAKDQKKGSAAASISRRSAKKWFKSVIAIIVFLSCMAGGFLFISRSQPVQKFLTSFKKDHLPSKGIIAKQPVPKARKYKTGELVLNGTSLIDGKKVALINDEIYEIGEVINGNKITSIELNKVELLGDEKIITLKVH